ncbi:MAG: Nitrite/Sulfite reductase ferredoxin-like half domain protein [Marmoricola sp.]|nr:Nitrite/Sulfite reductase ferredoxin-like half domain protein [Marmoricola sp.]
MPHPSLRLRRDRCPGVLRPWPADDGALVRVRLPGGHLRIRALAALAEIARVHGDDEVHLTGRANLQLRALPFDGDTLPAAVVDAVDAAGLLPSRTHELVRNIMCSPLTGLAGGRADLRRTTRELDDRLQASPELRDLPGRFLLVLDDGRGDLVDRDTDLGAVALTGDTAQLRVGETWGPVVAVDDVPTRLVELAERFLRRRGGDETAPWHVVELPAELEAPRPADPRVPAPSGIPAYDGVEHVEVPGGVLTAALVRELVDRGRDLVVTPWHGIVVTP